MTDFDLGHRVIFFIFYIAVIFAEVFPAGVRSINRFFGVLVINVCVGVCAMSITVDGPMVIDFIRVSLVNIAVGQRLSVLGNVGAIERMLIIFDGLFQSGFNGLRPPRASLVCREMVVHSLVMNVRVFFMIRMFGSFIRRFPFGIFETFIQVV